MKGDGRTAPSPPWPANGSDIDPDLLRFLSPLGWEHINLTGRLHLAPRQRHQTRQIQATTTPGKTLALDISLFHKPPPVAEEPKTGQNPRYELSEAQGVQQLAS